MLLADNLQNKLVWDITLKAYLLRLMQSFYHDPDV